MFIETEVHPSLVRIPLLLVGWSEVGWSVQAKDGSEVWADVFFNVAPEVCPVCGVERWPAEEPFPCSCENPS